MAPTNLARKTLGRAVFFPHGGADRGTGTAVNSNPYEPPGFSPQGPASKTPFVLAAPTRPSAKRETARSSM